MDNGSTDSSVEMIKENFQQVTVVENSLRTKLTRAVRVRGYDGAIRLHSAESNQIRNRHKRANRFELPAFTLKFASCGMALR